MVAGIRYDEFLPRTTGPIDQVERTDCAAAGATGATVVSSEIRQGDPAEAILARAREVGADLLVLGRRGRGTLKGLLLGSVSQKLSALAESAVLTVK